jgi:O-antigen chain-terminating methyltransferase
MKPRLDELIDQLPELYQPIFGQDDLLPAKRPGDLPRTDTILLVASELSQRLGRPLRVLDLGSAQGYYTFLLGARGHTVVGIDYLPENVALCNELAVQFPDIDVAFHCGNIVDFASTTGDQKFDLVLVLSVLHHVNYDLGTDRARNLVRDINSASTVSLFETALREESAYWAGALPSDPRHILSDVPFLRVLSTSPTHLSTVARPLFFGSSRFGWIDGTLEPILEYRAWPHELGANMQTNGQRYFTFERTVGKCAAWFMAGEDVRVIQQRQVELRSERQFLAESGMPSLPSLIDFSEGCGETFLVREKLQGALLSEVRRSLTDSDRFAILSQVVSTLASFESAGWYHSDLRCWNVLWDSSAGVASLIDFGSLRRTATDVTWPHDSYYSMYLFTSELWSDEDEQTGLYGPRTLRPHARLPALVRAFLQRLIAAPRNDTVFRSLSEFLSLPMTDHALHPDPIGIGWISHWGELLMSAQGEQARLAQLCTELNERLVANDAQTARVTDEMTRLSADVLRLEHEATESRQHTLQLERELEAERGWRRNAQEKMALASGRAAVQASQLAAERRQSAQLLGSASWRLTRPLRTLRSRLPVRASSAPRRRT